jgi:hypothetical protein
MGGWPSVALSSIVIVVLSFIIMGPGEGACSTITGLASGRLGDIVLGVHPYKMEDNASRQLDSFMFIQHSLFNLNYVS